MDLFDLHMPNELILEVLKRMKPIDFTRMVRSCRFICDVAEAGQEKIQILLRSEENYVFRMRIRVENEHPENDPSLTLLHLNIAKTRKSGRFICDKEKNYICSTAQLEGHLKRMGLGYFKFFELSLYANRLGKNQLVTYPIADILKRNHITCYKLEAPTCDWVPAAVSSVYPQKWTIYDIFANSDLRTSLPRNLRNLHVTHCFSSEDIADFLLLLDRGSKLSIFLNFEPHGLFAQIADHLNNIRLGAHPPQKVKIRCEEFKKGRFRPQDFFDFPYTFYEKMSFAYGKSNPIRTREERPNVFISPCEAPTHGQLVIVTYSAPETLPNQFKYFRYGAVSTWREFVSFMYEMFHTTERLIQQDQKMTQIRRDIFGE